MQQLCEGLMPGSLFLALLSLPDPAAEERIYLYHNLKKRKASEIQIEGFFPLPPVSTWSEQMLHDYYQVWKIHVLWERQGFEQLKDADAMQREVMSLSCTGISIRHIWSECMGQLLICGQ